MPLAHPRSLAFLSTVRKKWSSASNSPRQVWEAPPGRLRLRGAGGGARQLHGAGGERSTNRRPWAATLPKAVQQDLHIIITIQSTSCTSYIHEMYVLFVSFFCNQRITQKSIIFHPRDFSYGFQRNLNKCTINTRFSLLKNIIFLFFSKLDLSAYLSYYTLFIAFYLKNYCIFYHNLSKSSCKSHSNARGIT